MNIFKPKTLTIWQVGCIKLTMLAFGLAIGATWSSVFVPYTWCLIILGVILAIYLLFVWFQD